MSIAVVIEKGARLPEQWIAEPNVLVITQSAEETEAEFTRRLRRRLARYARLSSVRYYAAATRDSAGLRRFRMATLRTLLRRLCRSAELNLVTPATGLAQTSFFSLIEGLRQLPGRAELDIRLTFVPHFARSGLAALG